MGQIFVAFSEYLNLAKIQQSLWLPWDQWIFTLYTRGTKMNIYMARPPANIANEIRFIQQKILKNWGQPWDGRPEVCPVLAPRPCITYISQPVQCGWLCQVKRQYVRQNAERITADVVILMRGFVITAFIPVSALAPTITSSSIPQFYIQLLSL